MKRSLFILSVFLFVSFFLTAQPHPDYWQQQVEYKMEVDLDVETHQFSGTQELVYYNHSPDTLYKVFYHLYFNAFQPGSMMDVRSRDIIDPDSRIGDRIRHLSKEEQGFLHINSLKQRGKSLSYNEEGTILEVELNKPILPGSKTSFDMEFTGQVPVQVRRSGRDNKEGIAYTMTQWYPKMAEYDYEGWHAHPYIAREFHGVWGDFDVRLTLDSAYVVAATGVLQNPKNIGHGYLDPGKKLKRPDDDKLTWHFKAENVHDFAWSADPDYEHVRAKVPNGPDLHFFYQPDSLTQFWSALPPFTVKMFEFMNRKFGKYPYPQYTIAQGGDGGMEYAMITMITGHRRLGSLVGVTAHEMAHSWFHMVLGTNESLYPWMDEGFTSYSDNLIMDHLFDSKDPHRGSYESYFRVVESGREEPMSTHADFYTTNQAYGAAAYGKGSVFLVQLGYIIGEANLEKMMRRYYQAWKFKHPAPDDFKKIAEKVSGLELDWYFEQWLYTTNTIDYGIRAVYSGRDSLLVILNRERPMPMPVDLKISYRDGSHENFTIPLTIMRGHKQPEEMNFTVLPDWQWVDPTYHIILPKKGRELLSIEIDPSGRLADVDEENNVLILDFHDEQP